MADAIRVTDVTKIYRLYNKPVDRLKESLSLTKKNYHRDFYALKGISFDIKKGESVGIIGVNGSGKSTILKIITGVLTPTTGAVAVDGRISALLELGAGFNNEYTGIENIYMNGTMMGYTRAEMDSRLKDILDFADIGDFVNQPVKSYSSGMFVRLAFALAINVDPEILIVDEALSVGDIFFQSKCYARMDELRAKGTTILMVTHDMSSVLKYCDRAIILNKGEKVSEGNPGRMVDLYKKILAGQYDQLHEMLDENKAANARFDQTGLSDNVSRLGERAKTQLTGESQPDEGRAGSRAASCAQAAGDHKTHPTDSNVNASGHDGSIGGKICVEGNAGGGNANEGNANEGNADEGNAGYGESLIEDAGDESRLMRNFMTINPYVNEYGNGKAEIYDFGILDKDGRLTNLILKGERFTIREKIRFFDHIEAPIFTYTFRDKKGTDLTGTNTMFENAGVMSVDAGDEYEAEFTQYMDLQGGEYLISMSCTGFEQGEHTVYHRLYDLLNLTVISNKNTVGVYDMNSEVKVVKNHGRG